VKCFGNHGERNGTCGSLADWFGLGELPADDRVRQLLDYALELAVQFMSFNASIRFVKHPLVCEACVERNERGEPTIMTTPAFMAMIMRRFGEWAVVGIFLHELAHIALGHLDQGEPRTSIESMGRESAADAWALKATIRGRGNVNPFIAFLGTTGSGGGSHPPGRMRAELALEFARREIARLLLRRSLAV